MKKPQLSSSLISTIFKVFIFCLLAALFVYCFPRYETSFHRHFEVGKPWGYDLVTAEEDFPIYKTEQQLQREQQEVLKDFAPYFKINAEAASSTHPLVMSTTERRRLVDQGYTAIAVVDNHHSTRYPLEQIETPKSIYAASAETVNPNLTFDTLTTQRAKDALIAEISLTQGLVQQGERIIDRGEIVTEQTYQILVSLEKALQDNNITKQQTGWHIAGETMLVVLFIFLFVIYLYVFRPSYLQQISTVLFFAVLSTIIVIPSCLLLRYTNLSLFLIPFAWVPVLTRVFFDARTALFLHWMVVLIVSLIVPAPFEFIIIQVAIGIVAVANLRDLTKRAQLTQTAGWIFLVYAFSYTAVTLLVSGDWQALKGINYLYFAINAIFVVFSYGLIYIFERSFHLLSSLTLIELSDFNSELLRTLAEKAPGTFQHSVQVSSLATDAAKAVGANTILVRTGALYHDIGKTVHPEYFIENQIDGENILLKMEPQQAAQCVISHVIEGEAIGRKHHLPQSIIHFIVSHHGTSLVKYFYNTAVNAGQAPDPLQFQYPGPKPSTKESAILMMADAVEARSRSLTTFTEQTVSQAVDQMIDAQIADGQLNETPLSFRDVALIRELFKEKLLAMYHRRIQYPTIKKE